MVAEGPGFRNLAADGPAHCCAAPCEGAAASVRLVALVQRIRGFPEDP